MIYLILASTAWAFSFGIIKHFFAGMPPVFLLWWRCLLAFLVFILFNVIRSQAFRRETLRSRVICFAGGALQLGITYYFYLQAFQFLKSFEIALLAAVTPLWLALFQFLFQNQKKRVPLDFWIAVVAVIAGSWILLGWNIGATGLFSGETQLRGFVLMQVSNVLFASGVYFCRHGAFGFRPNSFSEVSFGAGALFAASSCVVWTQTSWITLVEWPLGLSFAQQGFLFYLGVIGTGLGFFWWNKGVAAVSWRWVVFLSNSKTWGAVLVSAFIFLEPVRWSNLLLGGGLILSGVAFSEWRRLRNAR